MPSGSRIVLRTSAEVDIPTPDTDQSTLFMDSDASNEPAWKDDAGVVHSLQGADGALTYTNHGNTGASEDVDVSTNLHRLVFNAATVTITTSGWPASGTPGIARLYIVQDGTGSRLASWPGAFAWGTAGAPTLQTAAAATDVIDIQSVDGGTTIYASVAGRVGATGASGTNGQTGGPVSIPYTFSTTTTDSDPGSGNLRLDNATQLSATKIRADLVSSDGTTWTSVLDTLDDSTNTVKGHIRLFKTSDPTKWIVFTVSAVDSSSGYRNITVAEVAGSGANPFANSDAITLTFERAGDAGSGSGATISTVDAVLSGNVTMTSANTFYDGPSASFAAGTWLIVWKVLIQTAGTSVHQYTAKLWDGSTVYDSSQNDALANPNGHAVEVHGNAIVTLGSTTTLKVSATDAFSASQTMLRDPNANSPADHTASRMVGYKVV